MRLATEGRGMAACLRMAPTQVWSRLFQSIVISDEEEMQVARLRYVPRLSFVEA